MMLSLSLVLAVSGCNGGEGPAQPANGASASVGSGAAPAPPGGAGQPGAAPNPGTEPVSPSVSVLLASVKVTQVDMEYGAYLQPGQTARVGTGPISFALAFRSPMERAAVENRLQVTGGAPAMAWPRPDLLQLSFPAGADGEQVEVRLGAGLPLPGGGELPADLVYSFRRAMGAAVGFLLEGKALAWPVSGRSYLSVTGPVQLGLQFSQPVDRATVEASLVRAGARGGIGIQVTWTDDLNVTASLTGQPGQELRVDLNGARDREDQPVALDVPALVMRWGEQTKVYTISAGGGGKKEILALPHAVPAARSSPTGRRLVYLEGGGQGGLRVWVVELKGDTVDPWDTGLLVSGIERVKWAGDRRLLVADGAALWSADTGARKVERLSSGPADGIAGSADGRLTAWLQTRPGAAGTMVYDLHYRESSQGATGFQAEVVRKDGPLPSVLRPEALALSADGTLIAIGSSPSPVPAAMIFTTDGQVQRELPLPGSVRDGLLAWSPGGDYLLASQSVVDSGTGEAVGKLTGALRASWAPSGARVAYSGEVDGKPSQVWVLDIATGKLTLLAQGVAAGWASSTQVLILAP